MAVKFRTCDDCDNPDRCKSYEECWKAEDGPNAPDPVAWRNREYYEGFARVLENARKADDRPCTCSKCEKIRWFRAVRARFLAAYVVESRHPDCAPSRRFRATRPDGTMAYGATREAAEGVLRKIVEPEEA